MPAQYHFCHRWRTLKNIKAPEDIGTDQFTNMTVNPKTNEIYVSSDIRNQFFVINGSKDSVERSSKFMSKTIPLLFLTVVLSV